eukprot:CAMPEP_0184718040 /NCGR_PEP_ID=MMETSP0314-20130426/7338_1 /TAXON_ID=38298 /ORGANISM="Rhodella maculata, Strain CCMP 736" /LENGTH=254 /DNA_ID=CAMNT_0027181709 /DNA_START=79 /DNA_END=840 /DNA_ORIENTATION=-
MHDPPPDPSPAAPPRSQDPGRRSGRRVEEGMGASGEANEPRGPGGRPRERRKVSGEGNETGVASVRGWNPTAVGSALCSRFLFGEEDGRPGHQYAMEAAKEGKRQTRAPQRAVREPTRHRKERKRKHVEAVQHLQSSIIHDPTLCLHTNPPAPTPPHCASFALFFSGPNTACNPYSTPPSTIAFRPTAGPASTGAAAAPVVSGTRAGLGGSDLCGAAAPARSAGTGGRAREEESGEEGGMTETKSWANMVAGGA